jgi:hypothetical protein
MLRAMHEALKNNNLSAAHVYAKDAAPYIHPKLAAIEHTGKDGGAIETKDVTARDRIAGRIARFVPSVGEGCYNSKPV